MVVKADDGSKGNDQDNSNVRVDATPQLSIAMPPPPSSLEVRKAMPFSTSVAANDISSILPSPQIVNSQVERQWTAESNEELARIRASDIEPRDGVPSAAYLRTAEALASSLRTNGAAVLEPSLEDSTILQCALQATRLYAKRSECSRIDGSGNEKPEKSKEDHTEFEPFEHLGHVCCSSCSCKLHKTFTFRAQELDVESSDESVAPPLADRVFAILGRVARISLAAVGRTFPVLEDSVLTKLDSCPLKLGDNSSSFLSVTTSLSAGCPAKAWSTQPRGSHDLKSPSDTTPGETKLQHGTSSHVAMKVEDNSGADPEPTSEAAKAEHCSEDEDFPDIVTQGLLLVVAADLPGLEVCCHQQLCEAPGCWSLPQFSNLYNLTPVYT